MKTGVNDGGMLYGINKSIHHVDTYVIVILGAFGCFLSGLIYSIFSHWGFVKYKWIIFKWIITIFAILFGTFFLGPWEVEMMEISHTHGIKALTDTKYLYCEKMNFIFGTLQCLVLITTVFISIFKPWTSRNKGKRGSAKVIL